MIGAGAVDHPTVHGQPPIFSLKPMGEDHPIAWTNQPKTGGRFFYTEFGHDMRSLSTPFVRQHILEGIRWAAKASP